MPTPPPSRRRTASSRARSTRTTTRGTPRRRRGSRTSARPTRSCPTRSSAASTTSCAPWRAVRGSPRAAAAAPGSRTSSAACSAEGQPGGGRVRYTNAPGGAAGFEDLLGGLFGNGGGAGGFGPQQGADLATSATLPFRQAVEGSTVSLSVEGRTVNARIPAGVRDGQKIRLRGKGRPGAGGGPAGDLVITVRVTPHPVFTIDGENLRITVPVAFDEAALGATIEVPTLDGSTVRVKVPEGTPSGRVLRVKGKGIPGSKGDLLITVQVVVPQRLSSAAREAVQAFGIATSGEDVRADLLDAAKK